MEIKNVTDIIEDFAPLSYQESYDNSGLIVGHPSDNVEGILICIDSTEDVVDEAIKKKCNLIIAHHPILFTGIKQLNGKNYIERTIIKAIKNNIAIYACHTNLDNVFGGVSFKMAQQLGLKNCEILAPQKDHLKKIVTYCPTKDAAEVRDAMFKAGGGSIGDYSNCSFNSDGEGTFKGNENTNPSVGTPGKVHHETETKIEMVSSSQFVGEIVKEMVKAHPYEEVAYDIYSLDNSSSRIGSGVIGELEIAEETHSFLKRIKSNLKTDGIRYTNPPNVNQKVKRIAVCGGSGSFLLSRAKAVNADVFITSDFKYHQFFDAENEIIVADIGHYESEQFTCELFYDILNKKIPNFAVYLSEINTNPVNYL